MYSQRTKRRRIANEVESLLNGISNYSSGPDFANEVDVCQGIESLSTNNLELTDTTICHDQIVTGLIMLSV